MGERFIHNDRVISRLSTQNKKKVELVKIIISLSFSFSFYFFMYVLAKNAPCRLIVQVVLLPLSRTTTLVAAAMFESWMRLSTRPTFVRCPPGCIPTTATRSVPPLRRLPFVSHSLWRSPPLANPTCARRRDANATVDYNTSPWKDLRIKTRIPFDTFIPISSYIGYR